MHARLTQLHPKMKLREHFDYVRLAACGWYMVFKLLNCFFDNFLISFITQLRESAMPIELLVPITVFLLGVVASISLAGMGIDRIVEANKK